ncbi:MAG: hypothetical protein IKM25_03630 [Clostridia bacterium]|nr:hypothetical protein [Clostridia bacterium]
MKKLIAVILSAIMIFSVLAPAASATSEKCNCGTLPTIYVGPLGNTDIYEDFGTENQRTLFRPATDTIIKIVLKVLPSIVPALFTRDFTALGDALIESVYDAFGAMALDGNGNSAENVTVDIELPEETEHGKGNQYYFHYDWRLDPVEVAGQLDEFVEHVKKLTGHDQVNFRASSMGGVVTLAYFNEYGCDDVDACIFQSCPLLGTDVAGDLLSRKLALDSRRLLDYATDGYPPFTFGDTLLWGLFNGLFYSGLVDLVYAAAGKILDNLQTRVFDELLTPVFGTLLGLWAFVPDCSYEEAKKINLDPETQAGLIKKADYYHYQIQQRADEILNGAIDDGVRIMIVAGYNIQRTPLVENMYNNSDATVDTKYASAGATVALLNETLGDDYKQACTDCGHNHLSPDGVIDASTCILPEHTWFIKDMLHSNAHDGIMEMYYWFMYADEYYDVWSNPAYTQFIQNDKPNLRVIPMGNFAEGDVAPEFEEGDSFYNKFEKYVAPVTDRIFSVLDKCREWVGLDN